MGSSARPPLGAKSSRSTVISDATPRSCQYGREPLTVTCSLWVLTAGERLSVIVIFVARVTWTTRVTSTKPFVDA